MVVVFGDYRVSPNFLVVLGLVLWLRLWLGCDNNIFLSEVEKKLIQLKSMANLFIN